MRLLLDSHVWLWMLTEPERLNQSTQAMLADAATAVFVSAASVWELAIKHALGKIAVPPGLVEASEDQFLVRFLPISVSHALAAPRLPLLHSAGPKGPLRSDARRAGER